MKRLAMQRAYIWILCLTFGLTIKSCSKPLISWANRIDFIFINQTDHLIELKVWSNYEDDASVPLDDQVRTITIQPQTTSNTLSMRDSGNKKIDVERQRSGAVWTLLGPGKLKHEAYSMLIDNITCAVFEGNGFAQPSNYQYEVLGDRHVKYMYTFTDADFENMVECDEYDSQTNL